MEKNLGREWTKRLIPSRDKTLIRGNILIDDKSEVTGLLEPSWEHVIYTQPYNDYFKGKRRLNWQNWKEVLTEL